MITVILFLCLFIIYYYNIEHYNFISGSLEKIEKGLNHLVWNYIIRHQILANFGQS